MQGNDAQLIKRSLQKLCSRTGSILMRDTVKTIASDAVPGGYLCVNGIRGRASWHARMKSCVEYGNMRNIRQLFSRGDNGR